MPGAVIDSDACQRKMTMITAELKGIVDDWHTLVELEKELEKGKKSDFSFL